jgi:putative transcriptional regulator
MTPNHHPFPETLISFVSGTLPDATSCVVVCHLSMCSDCANHVRRLEMLGG